VCRWLWAGMLVLMLAGCGDRGKDLYETGRFEERQFNAESAAQRYREVLDRYPDSAYAPLARERLEALRESGKVK